MVTALPHAGSMECMWIEEVWSEFSLTGSVHLRNRLMEHYRPLVRYHAERIGATLPEEVDLDDLVSDGVFGLMDAIDAFDLARGYKFETFCKQRVRGAILDGLREMDIVPRLVRSRARKIDRAARELEVELCRCPHRDEIAERLGLSDEQFEQLLAEATAVGFVSLTRPHLEAESGRDVREIDIVADRRAVDPVIDQQGRDVRAMLGVGMGRAEQLIVLLYYYEDLTMKEIGRVLDLSESRVSQMHSQAIARLRERLVGRVGELVA